MGMDFQNQYFGGGNKNYQSVAGKPMTTTIRPVTSSAGGMRAYKI